jgi:glycerol-3-phosphate O-acyltransferase
MVDEITQAVLSRDDIARYLQDSHRGHATRERIHAYLEELRTTQRYSIYRALKHPLYPILRKIDRIGENVEIVKTAARAGRVVYASNHRSHTDYLAEPLVLDDNGIRPPIIAAGINLFGGPLGLLHRHVTGAMPVRRNTKDPVYLVTLKAYVAELLRRHDLFFYPEGGRSYSGELKSPKTGLLHAALQADVPRIAIIPTAIAYDLVLEDHVLARQRDQAHAEGVHARARRDGALRRRLPLTRDRHLRQAVVNRRRRSDVAPRGARLRALADGGHRSHSEGAADRRGGQCDASIHHAEGARSAGRGGDRYAALRGRQPRRRVGR